MGAILDSIRKASALMSEIASASEAQSKDIEQVNRAVSEMDHVTQQNAALVEQASAAALSMKEQAGQLDNAVSVFVVGKH
jgi:methyl-accepting chemotaxis protein